jgi:hypothetical protein
LRCVRDARSNETFSVLFLVAQGGQGLTESFDFAQPPALLGLDDALSEVSSNSRSSGSRLSSVRSMGQRMQACSWAQGVP